MSLQPLITVHWLEASRAQRIVYLLEELNLSYTLKLYHRNERKRAPAELKKIHPFGKSPLVELDYGGGQTKVLAESGHIINYLIKHFDKEGKFQPVSEEDAEEVDYYLHMTEGTLQPPITFLAVMGVGDEKAPFMVKSVVRNYNAQVRESYNYPEVVQVLEFLEDALEKKTHGGTSTPLYFVGEKLSAADVALSYPVCEVCFTSSRLKECVDKKKYPHLVRWSQQIMSSPAWRRAFDNVEGASKGQYIVKNK